VPTLAAVLVLPIAYRLGRRTDEADPSGTSSPVKRAASFVFEPCAAILSWQPALKPSIRIARFPCNPND